MKEEWTDEEGEALAAWSAPVPPPGFADRVLAQREAPASPRGTARWVIALAAAIVVATVGFFVTREPGVGGRARATRRETVALASRGVAVLERGASIHWTVQGSGSARVRQSAGNVFYRVEPGGSFVVTTPAGAVVVRGTCLRVEVSRRARPGGARVPVVWVSVYEGHVRFENQHAGVALGPGDLASATAGEAPRHEAPSDDSREAEIGDPPRDATREELLARERALRRELARLRASQPQERTGPATAIADERGDTPAQDLKYLDLTQAELRTLADRCEVRFDLPCLGAGDVADAVPDPTVNWLSDAALSPEERESFQSAARALHREVVAQIRAIYVDATGDTAGASSLTPDAMLQEIEQKAAVGEMPLARRRIARERAGLDPLPGDEGEPGEVERELRLLATVGDRWERLVAEVVGPARARALRREHSGCWLSSSSRGCPGD